MTQNELDQFLAEQNESEEKPAPPAPPSNFNPYTFPPPAFGVPFGGIPPHLVPHMAQMMQNGSFFPFVRRVFLRSFVRSGFPGIGSMPPPPHLLRFLVPPLLNPAAATNTGKSIETIQTELRKVKFRRKFSFASNISRSQLRGQLKELEEKLAKVNADISMWSEFKNPDGRPYFYNTKSMESTWDKPLVFTDQTGRKKTVAFFPFRSTKSFFFASTEVENQLELVNKAIHESEKELKRLEKEQSQAEKTAAPSQPAAAPTPALPNLVTAFTLEKLDQNDLRRFVR